MPVLPVGVVLQMALLLRWAALLLLVVTWALVARGDASPGNAGAPGPGWDLDNIFLAQRVPIHKGVRLAGGWD